MHAAGTSGSAGQGCAALHAPATTASPTLKKRRSDPKVSPTAELKILSATDPNGLASTSCTHAAKFSHFIWQSKSMNSYICSNISQQLYMHVYLDVSFVQDFLQLRQRVQTARVDRRDGCKNRTRFDHMMT